MTAPKTVGAMNGRWAMLLKVSLVCFPLFATGVTGWASWATMEILHGKFFREFGPRFTQGQASSLEAKIERKLDSVKSDILALPPTDWRRRITNLEKDVHQLEEDTRTVIQQNGQILMQVQHIKERLDNIKGM